MKAKPDSRLTEDQIDSLRPQLAQLRLVFVALWAGVLLFGVVAILLGEAPVLELPPSNLSLIIAAVAIVTGLPGLVIPMVVRNATRQNMSDATPRKLAGAWASSAIVGCALFEGSAFLSLIGFIMTSNVIHLVLAGFFAVLMFVHFPGTNRVLDWIESARAGR